MAFNRCGIVGVTHPNVLSGVDIFGAGRVWVLVSIIDYQSFYFMLA